MAGLSVGIKDNIKDVKKYLTNLQREQLPFATAKALTDTAWNARLFAQDGMVRDMDKPKAYTLNAFKIGKATKRNQTAYIDIKPKQWEYLQWVVLGGAKKSPGTPYSVPWDRKRMTRSAYAKLVARDDTFVATIKGIRGIWQRVGRYNVKLLFASETKVDYDPNSWRYRADVERAVRARFPYHFNKAIRHALKTAR